MVSMTTPDAEIGKEALDFSLPGTDGLNHTLSDLKKDARAFLVMFICNHCPYVKAIEDRLIRDTKELLALGVKSVAISANDPALYPEDSFDNMARQAQEKAYPFPYLFDESQEVAKCYGAICTPDFFGYNADGMLQYRGRLDASRKEAASADAPRELFEAMKHIAETGHGPEVQHPSMGCSIKWKGD